MKRKILITFVALLCLGFSNSNKLLTPFEKSDGNYSATYEETIKYYQLLDSTYDKIKLITYGSTDIEKPLQLAVISQNKIFDPNILQGQKKTILMINNGIHPGEPEGIDASMMFARDLMIKPELSALLDHIVVIIIPMYNIGGALNRGSNSRANQNGPEAYGFRGNAKNIDLNRDFIKCDSKNAISFIEIFRSWAPHIFIDTHTSNGADYQYVMTYIATQKDKLNPILSAYLQKKMLPSLHKEMEELDFDMVPYVDPIQSIPDSGIIGFLETPRYSTGYTTLFNSIGFTLETHMLKPFAQRVAATYGFLQSTLTVMHDDHLAISTAKANADQSVIDQESFSFQWKVNKEQFEMINFKGYEAKYTSSEVTTDKRLSYDQSKPFEKPIRYYNSFTPQITVNKPFAYIIPKGWDNIITLLKNNGVLTKRFEEDLRLEVEVYYIDNFETTSKPFEGHYLHYNTKIRKEIRFLNIRKGDHYILMDQATNRFVVEVLEPEAIDSYFNWNYFDQVLQQKEWYSSYVFEDVAAQLLKDDPELNKRLGALKKSDPEFAKDPRAQLYFIYKNSIYFEKNTFLQYPIYRVPHKVNLR